MQEPLSNCNRPRRGLTLIELLLVVAIIGIAAAVVMPRFSVAMSGGQISVAARTLTQAARYARTMAVLYQVDTELTIETRAADPPEVVVGVNMVRGVSRDAIMPAEIDPTAMLVATDTFSDDMREPTTLDIHSDMADEIRMSHRLSGVSVSFLGYRDAVGGPMPLGLSADDGEGTRKTVRVRYNSNGSCRPYALRVTGGGGVWRDLRVDRVGGVTVMDPNA